MQKGSDSVFSWKISPHDNGTRLLAFLRENFANAPSVKALKRGIETKHCTINGRVEVFSSHILETGDVVVFDPAGFETPPEISLLPLYEDEALLVVNKPAGLVCDEGVFAKLLGQRVILVHRLDKETSGVLILAKNRKIQAEMIEIFRRKEIKKRYLALVDGSVAKAQGKVENFLGKVRAFTGQTVYGSVTAAKGQEAITLWKCLKKVKEASLLLCELVTGRTHQLRVHLSEMGHPILGDTQYGKKFRSNLQPKRHLLHAYTIAFAHPTTGRELSIVAPLPVDFKQAIVTVFSDDASSLTF